MSDSPNIVNFVILHLEFLVVPKSDALATNFVLYILNNIFQKLDFLTDENVEDFLRKMTSIILFENLKTCLQNL